MSLNYPENSESYWRASTGALNSPKLVQDRTVDACVVGGGIAGISTAYLLAKSGLRVILIEAGQLFSGATGFTTAKVTAQHGVIYDELIRSVGPKSAKLYYQMQQEAISHIKTTVQDLQIDCAYMNEDAYLYTNADSDLQKLQDEFNAYQALGIDSRFTQKIDIPVPHKAAIVMKNQGQFHPLQYLTALAKRFIEFGGEIFENTLAVDVKHNGTPIVITEDGHSIHCKHAVICSHFPFVDKMGIYFARMHAERSYVLALKTDITYPGGMYINTEQPARSIRQVNFNGESLLLVGGESHITARGDEETSLHYDHLLDFASSHFAPKEIVYRWSTQDLVTIDKLPFIGSISSGNADILVATGFRKWGMTNGVAAALLNRDIVLKRLNRFKELVTPSRFIPSPSIKNMTNNVMEMAKELIGGKLEMVVRNPEDLRPDEGDVVAFSGKHSGAYRDPNGQLHIVDTTCTHMGCELKWNRGERSWDCPCHGSRFNYQGDVLEGPAKKPLKKYK